MTVTGPAVTLQVRDRDKVLEPHTVDRHVLRLVLTYRCSSQARQTSDTPQVRVNAAERRVGPHHRPGAPRGAGGGDR
jgi:hypothetical protein